MSTQADRIRTFKYMQCIKIKKEEEEEWLSGEELCTEGSSDEDTSHRTKLRKSKIMQRQTTKQTISPLAQQHTTESVVLKTPEEQCMSMDHRHCESSENRDNFGLDSSLETTTETLETEFEVAWRPKRGSLQLPSCSEEQSRLTACYEEMLETLQFLKPAAKKCCRTTEDDSATASDVNDINKLIDNMNNCDSKISENYKLWKEVQQERMEIEKELQKKFLESSLSWEKNSIFFMNFTNQEFIEDDKRVGKVNAEKCSKSSCLNEQQSGNKDFIARNIELARNGAMAAFSLTDEEKSKLETLLSDIGNEEFNEIQSHENLSSEDSDGEESDSDIRNEHAVNEFRLTAEEQKRMAELEAKMEEMLDAFPEQLQDERQNMKNFEDPLKQADEKGRLWKYAELEERIKDIDKKLESLAAKECEGTQLEKCDDIEDE